MWRSAERVEEGCRIASDSLVAMRAVWASSLKGDPLGRNAQSRRERLSRLQKELGKMSCEQQVATILGHLSGLASVYIP